MDFGTWSPSHTILVIVVVVGFVGQVAVLFYRTGQIEKRVAKLAADTRQQREEFIHAIERLEERTDKRFVEVNQQIAGLRLEMGQQITGLRSEMNQRISEVRDEISEVRTEIVGIRTEMSKLNQNHIDHLTHHHDS